MTNISWTKTALIKVDDIPFSKMREWEKWQLENDAQWISGFTEIERSGPEMLNFKGVFKLNKGDKALAVLKRILGETGGSHEDPS